MNLQELRTFLSIVETGSLVRASQVLNVTQSTVTARLKSLEEELGQALLVRNKSGATLTAAGEKLRRYADTIVNLWQQARQDAGLPEGVSGVCNFACEQDLWPVMGETFVETLMALCPDIGLSIWVGSQADVTAWLSEGKSDLAITTRGATSSRQGQVALPGDALVLVSSDPSSPERFDPGYVYVEAGDAFGRAHAVAYADAGVAQLSFGNATVALEHVLRVGGSAYLPARMVRPHLECGRLFAREGELTFSRAIYLTYDSAQRGEWPWFDDVLAQSGVLGSA